MNKKLKVVAHKHRKKRRTAKLKIKELKLKEQNSKEQKAKETRAREHKPETVAEEVPTAETIINPEKGPKEEIQTTGDLNPESPKEPNQ